MWLAELSTNSEAHCAETSREVYFADIQVCQSEKIALLHLVGLYSLMSISVCVVLGTALAPLRPSPARSKSRTYGREDSSLKLQLLCLMHVGKAQTVVQTFYRGSAGFKIHN